MTRLRAYAYGLPALFVFMTAAVLTTALVAWPAPLARRRRICQRAIRWALNAAAMPVHVRGLEHLPQGPAVVVCNHASMLDGLIVFSRLPDHYTFVVRVESRRTPVFGYLLDRSGVIWLTRGEARSGARTLRRLIREVRDGAGVTLFPEGTILDTPGLQPFKPGAFLLACKAGCPLLPAVISGTRTALPDQALLPTRHPIHLQFLPPRQPGGSDRAHAMQLLNDVRAAMAEQCDEPDLTRTTDQEHAA